MRQITGPPPLRANHTISFPLKQGVPEAWESLPARHTIAKPVPVSPTVNLCWSRQLDSLLTEAYDDSSYGPVVTLHHTDRENRTMASVFSTHGTSLPHSSHPNDQLTQSPCADHCSRSPHHIQSPSSTVELIRNAPHPFMEPRRMTSAHP